MGSVSRRYRVNSRDVVHELIDGEVIAIDLGRGSYFSLAGGAADVWSMLESGASAEDLVAAFDGGAEREEIETEVAALLRALAAESLIVPDDSGGPAGGGAGGEVPYRKPVFEKYEDMQDYFMLDPIHEVGSAGWPRPQGA